MIKNSVTKPTLGKSFENKKMQRMCIYLLGIFSQYVNGNKNKFKVETFKDKQTVIF